MFLYTASLIFKTAVHDVRHNLTHTLVIAENSLVLLTLIDRSYGMRVAEALSSYY